MKIKYKQLIHPVVAVLVSTGLLAGCRNYLAFSTATKFGLDISQRSDQQPEVTVGYQRTEIASIPVREHRQRTGTNSVSARKTYPGDADTTNDAYAVLGLFGVTYDPNVLTGGVHIKQVFATGMAARIAAADTNVATIFGGVTRQVINNITNKSDNNN